MQKIICGIYGRQSEGKELAITDQVEECTDDATAQGWRILDTYSDYESASEYNTRHKRPGWVRLEKDISAGKINAVVVWELSRLDRRPTPFGQFIDLCRKKGVVIRVTQLQQTYNPDISHHRNELYRRGVTSAEESDLRSDRNTRGALKAAKRGRPPGGPVPLGYKRSRNKDDAPIWVVDEEKRPTAVAIFEAVANLRTLREVAREHEMDVSVLRRMIRNPAYIALRKHTPQKTGKTTLHKAEWPPIIDEELWKRANAALDQNKKRFRPAMVRMLLTGIVKCGVCGGAVTGDSMTRRGMLGPRYGCREKGCVWFDAREADDLVQTRLFETLADPEYHHAVKVAAEADNEQVQQIKDQIRDKEQYISELKEASRQRQQAALHLADIIIGVQADISRLTGELERLSMPESVYQLMMDLPTGHQLADWREGITPAMELLMERYERMPLGERRALIDEVLIIKAYKSSHRGVRMPVEKRLTIEPRHTR